MHPPDLPSLKPLKTITPSLYNMGLSCLARLLWAAFGDRKHSPETTSAILGNAFHGVLEDCAKGRLPTDASARKSAAASLFDQKAVQEIGKAHPLLRWRYPDVRRMPYYFTFQARAGTAALEIASRQPGASGNSGPVRRAEWRLKSIDRLVEGRIDLVDTRERAVIDYKTGGDPPTNVVFRVQEERQLRLYAHLCAENNVVIDKGVIVRGSGRRDEMVLTDVEASAEGHAARALRADLNARISTGKTIHDFADPSPENCRGCPGRVRCEPYWSTQGPDWQEAPPTRVEGEVLSCDLVQVASQPSFTLCLRVLRGDVPGTKATTDAFPAALCTADGDVLPKAGDVVRLLDVWTTSGSPALIKPSLAGPLTTVWRLD